MESIRSVQPVEPTRAAPVPPHPPIEAEPGGRGRPRPEWEDPVLTTLAYQLRDAHRRVAGLPADTRRSLTRHLLTITDLAKRDPGLAARRLATFLTDMDTSTRR